MWLWIGLNVIQQMVWCRIKFWSPNRRHNVLSDTFLQLRGPLVVDLQNQARLRDLLILSQITILSLSHTLLLLSGPSSVKSVDLIYNKGQCSSLDVKVVDPKISFWWAERSSFAIFLIQNLEQGSHQSYLESSRVSSVIKSALLVNVVVQVLWIPDIQWTGFHIILFHRM